MESESSSLGVGAALGRWWGQSPQPSPSTDVMNQLCRVCAEPAAGFHFGAFTCEGCKSFFGRTYNNLGSITECKNNGECVINKKNRTACKACRLKKCLLVGMSKSGSRYGRRSNWFKIHCLLQEQQQAGAHLKDKSPIALWGESYKNLTTPTHFDSDSKGSPTEESITLNNNNLSKDRERSPNSTSITPYSAEAAAALWAARHSLFPLQLPHHPMPSLPMSFIPPFTNFPPPGHPQSQRNMLLPFMQNLQTSPSSQSNHHALTVSSSPSRSSEGSHCSQSPSPSINYHKNSSPSLDHVPEKHSTGEKILTENKEDKSQSAVTNLGNHLGKVQDIQEGGHEPNRKMAEEHSLALLRSLGPVQEQPMDLSVRVIEIKSRRKSKVSQRITTESEDKSEGSEDEAEDKEEVLSDGTEANDENFNKRKNPLDLTKPPKLEI
ncbi:hypothetical protein RUM43_013553 [Polyplax serrata]|uniref:Nuclear receptor domain-containing protein n=1 Tax=Polyplax serrata TaxID=468196 RepID=A0AAN8P0U5_POLSC